MRLLYLLLSLFCCVSVQAFERAELISPEDNLVVSFSNIATISERIERSPLGRIWHAPAMAGVRNNQKIESLFQALLLHPAEASSAMSERDRLQWEELQLLKGELVLGFHLSNTKSSGITLVAAMSQADYKKSLEIDERLSRLSSEEPRLHRSQFQGVEIISLRERTSGKVLHWQSWMKDTLLIFPEREQLERSLVKLRSASLQGTTKKSEFKIECPPSFFAYLQNALKSSLTEGGAAKRGVSPEGVVKAVGLSELQNAEIIIDFQEDLCDLTLQIQQKGPQSGFWKLISARPAPRGKLLNHVPLDVYSYGVSQVDLAALWRELPRMLGTMAPQMLSQFQTIVSMAPMMLQVDVTKDIFENLDSLMVSYSRIEKGVSQDLFALKLHSEDQMIMTLSKMFGPQAPLRSQMSAYMAQEDIAGTTVYSLTLPNREKGAPPQRYAVSVVNSYLLIGAPAFVRSMISQAVQGRGFYQSPHFKSMITTIPNGAMAYGYTDISRMLTSTIDELHARNLFAEFSASKKEPRNALEAFFNKLDISKMPRGKFFEAFIGNGFTYTSFQKGQLVTKTVLHYKGEGNE